MRSTLIGSITLAGALLAPALCAADQAPRMAVMALRVDTELPKGMDHTLNEILLGEFHRRLGQGVMGASDIAAMLQVEEQKMLLSCDEESCLSELGGALGVGLVVAPSIGAVGDRYVINLKLMDVAAAKVLARINQYVERDENEIVAGIRAAVGQLVAATDLSAAPAVEEGLGFMDVAPWLSLGLTAAAAGTGGAFGGLALKDDKTASRAIQGSQAWRSAHGSAQDRALVADVMFGLAGAAAVTTLILFLVDSGDETGPTAGLAPAADGRAAAFAICF